MTIPNLVLYQGTLNSSTVRAAEVFRPAITRKGDGIILVHNHPAKSAQASPEDVDLTKSLVEAGRLLEVELVDHLIIAGQQFVSLRDQLRW